MADETENELKAPEGKGRVVIRRAGEKFPPFREAVPELGSPSLRLAFRADAPCIDAINRHIERLADAFPGTVITMSDALRDLIRVGDEAAEQNNTET